MEINEIDNHVDKHIKAMSTSKAAFDLCKFYNGAKPVLEFAVKLLFFKPKWQGVLKSFITFLDTQCGS